ncbi:MAG: sigma-54-dependent Fis family transcriptional regulator [Firmicutes bacterium]|nr:sigma-54-dependent Fis family transcriptional regulator [Bacillota bacterium]
MDPQILLVDDEQIFLESMKRGLMTAGYRDITAIDDPARVYELIPARRFDIALVDLTMPDISGLELVEYIKSASPETECLMVTAVDEVETAVNAMRLGAYDYLIKPLSRDRLLIAIDRALERKRLLDLLEVQKQRSEGEFIDSRAFKDIVTVSPAMLRVLREVELHARSNAPVLITGESGTGKELLAHAIHQASSRADRSFVPVNMASLTGTLFESEFFGHVKGAFTGAERDREGYLEAAAGGTLFLDEIGDLSLDLQGKLLRVLQEKEFVKLGTNRVRRIEVRFVAATNSSLEAMVKKGQFRNDLYYRLKVAWIQIPPLRERLEDVRPLVEHFLKELGRGAGRNSIKDETLQILSAYQYPGNVRELRSILQSAANLAQKSPIAPSHLPSEVRKTSVRTPVAEPRAKSRSEFVTLAEAEREYILQVYKHTRGNKAQTARILGIGLTTLHRKLKEYGEE